MKTERIGGRAGFSSGAPTLVGRRLTVANIVSIAYMTEDLDSDLFAYELELEDVVAARDYCSARRCLTDATIQKFCANCLLREVQESVEEISERLELFGKSGDVEVFRGCVPEETLEDKDNRYWIKASNPIGALKWHHLYDESGKVIGVESTDD